MQKTTVYLPDGLKLRLDQTARATGRSSADLIREGIERVIDEHGLKRPRIPLFASTDPDLAEKADEALDGLGE